MPSQNGARHPVRRAVFVCGLGVAAVLAAFAIWWWSPGEDLVAWREGAPPRQWAAWQRQEERWREEGSHRRVQNVFVPLGAISVELQLAVLVGEDIDFFGHGPVDLDAIVEAVGEHRPGERLRGASTITQQLAKNLFLSGERTIWRKLKEIRLAWWLERRLGKRRILELYLNVVEFGPGLLGAEVASRRYFGVGARDLSAAQAAGLAAAIPAPGRDNPATASRRWQNRRAIIVRRMARADWLRGRLLARSAPANG
jgi:monofunctional biosynthetic peptidoglycan transglycosylase